ncbi:MAG: exodeoxyribonuclease VII large subunit [Parvularculaceae bacterium]|jgi:exodeoxyribonuclease VII large subunit|nr:exodeoxyribonuclease VII large subunit [Parvularculaceae bacterium]
MAENELPNLKEYSVSELAGALKRAIETGFPFVKVRGELGQVKRYGDTIYVDLKDENATLACVIWRNAASRLKIKPEQGMEVVATGRLSTYGAQSKYQLVIDSLEAAGVGALMALLEERKKKLAAEGLFDAARKRPIPYLPETIGVVTSPSGAVIRDILHRLRERFPRRVLVWPTPVQGKGAETKIAAAIEGFNALPETGVIPRPDVLIVARGGGSIEDLWCFNEEVVARAVAASRIPVISAVGHETDTTLIDFVADHRAPTPTAAAEKSVPMRTDLAARLATIEARLMKTMARAAERRSVALRAATRGLGRPDGILGPRTQRLDRAGDRLRAAAAQRLDAARLRASRPRFGRSLLAAGLAERGTRVHRAASALGAGAARLLDRRRGQLAGLRLAAQSLVRRYAGEVGRLDGLNDRLVLLAGRLLASREASLATAGKLLASLSYENVLARGFVLVQTPAGRLVAGAAEARPGAQVVLRFHDGARDAVISGGAGSKKSEVRPSPQKTLFD